MRAIFVSKKQEVFVVFLLTSGKKNVLYGSNGGNVASATKKEDKKMNHTKMLSIVKSFGFSVNIRTMPAETAVNLKAAAGNERAIKCVKALADYRASERDNLHTK